MDEETIKQDAAAALAVLFITRNGGRASSTELNHKLGALRHARARLGFARRDDIEIIEEPTRGRSRIVVRLK